MTYMMRHDLYADVSDLHAVVLTSHNLRVRSWLPETTQCGSLRNLAASTLPLWPVSVCCNTIRHHCHHHQQFTHKWQIRQQQHQKPCILCILAFICIRLTGESEITNLYTTKIWYLCEHHCKQKPIV